MKATGLPPSHSPPLASGTLYSSHNREKPHNPGLVSKEMLFFFLNAPILGRKVQDKHTLGHRLVICPHVTAIPTVPTRKPFYYLTTSTDTKLASGNSPIKHKLITESLPHLW